MTEGRTVVADPPISGAPSTGPAARRSPRRARGLGELSHTIGIFTAVIALGCIFTLFNSRFAAVTNLGIILSQTAILGIMAAGMTYVIVAGEIDLSVGSMFAVCAMVFALLLQDHINVYLAALLAILAGGGLGLVNGLLSVAFNVPTIIITLGTLNVYAGVVLWISQGLPVSNFSSSGPLFQFSQNSLPGPPGFTWVPEIAIAWVVVCVFAFLVLHNTTFGQRIYATGSNRRAALNAGISCGRVRIQTLVVVGLCAGIAGVLSVGQYGSASPGAGTSYNLSVIAAVIIGGAALTGGRGSVIASALGVLLIGEVSNGLVVSGVNIYGQVVAQGALVVLAVAIDRVVHGDTWYVQSMRRAWRATRERANLQNMGGQ
jgi:ribose/xylose/arabinose/galactoside ABC-type transport system permease subunit